MDNFAESRPLSTIPEFRESTCFNKYSAMTILTRMDQLDMRFDNRADVALGNMLIQGITMIV